MSAFVPVTKADLDDQRWLDQQVDALRDGIDAARDIWLNWTDGRNVSRLAPSLDYGEFIASQLGYHLPLAEVMEIMPDASTRAIAKVAGVSHNYVAETKRRVIEITPDDRPATVLGRDGNRYPARRVSGVVIDGLPMSEEEVHAAPVVGKRLTLTEVRGYVRSVENILALLQPSEVVPAALPVLRDLAPTLVSWAQPWLTELPSCDGE